MYLLIKISMLLIPILELVNVLKGGELSTADFTVISTTLTIITAMKAISLKEKLCEFILSAWLIFIVLYFAFDIGIIFFNRISFITNTINLMWFYIFNNINTSR